VVFASAMNLGPRLQGDIANSVGLAEADVTRLVQRLVASGLVVVKPKNSLSLTEHRLRIPPAWTNSVAG
jgi:DNA-binding IclR family transcriptional regulator